MFFVNIRLTHIPVRKSGTFQKKLLEPSPWNIASHQRSLLLNLGQ